MTKASLCFESFISAVIEVTFQEQDYVVEEEISTLVVCINVNTSIERTVLLSLQSLSLTANSGSKCFVCNQGSCMCVCVHVYVHLHVCV